ncbi:hypothetical protein [Cupriavidus sp. D384]|uniref:hypothetical protein n=1 Tax=Cupriavidus sp. D384 TaxID=1538095 RepID=UPI0012E70919|nr:hypothetical protein [Cupriavidus sp. D384]
MIVSQHDPYGCHSAIPGITRCVMGRATGVRVYQSASQLWKARKGAGMFVAMRLAQNAARAVQSPDSILKWCHISLQAGLVLPVADCVERTRKYSVAASDPARMSPDSTPVASADISLRVFDHSDRDFSNLDTRDHCPVSTN